MRSRAPTMAQIMIMIFVLEEEDLCWGRLRKGREWRTILDDACRWIGQVKALLQSSFVVAQLMIILIPQYEVKNSRNVGNWWKADLGATSSVLVRKVLIVRLAFGTVSNMAAVPLVIIAEPTLGMTLSNPTSLNNNWNMGIRPLQLDEGNEKI